MHTVSGYYIEMLHVVKVATFADSTGRSIVYVLLLILIQATSYMVEI